MKDREGRFACFQTDKERFDPRTMLDFGRAFVLSAEQCRGLDAVASEQLGVPLAELMERAADEARVRIARMLHERWAKRRVVGDPADHRRVMILCGPGNNGGDGLALARLMVARSEIKPVVIATCPAREGNALHRMQRTMLAKVGVRVRVASEATMPDIRERMCGCDVIVDALFGTGLSRPLTGIAGALVDASNGVVHGTGRGMVGSGTALAREGGGGGGRLSAQRTSKSPPLRSGCMLGAPMLVALDVPSGLRADGVGQSRRGSVIRATHTIAFACVKPVHLEKAARSLVGQLLCADIGVPEEAYRAVGAKRRVWVAIE